MTEIRDGVYKTRTGSHGEKLIQIRASSVSEYIRFVNEETGEIKLVPIK